MQQDDHSYTINEFCAAERISRGSLYNMWSKGLGPRWFNVGATRRITEKSRQDWHREREAGATTTTRGGHRTPSEAAPRAANAPEAA